MCAPRRAAMMAAMNRVIWLLVMLWALLAGTAHAAVPVTSRSDALRTGWYRSQPRLSPGVVTGGSFGQLFSAPVEGQVYAQPLVADDVLLVATEENWVYGLDPETGARRWSRNLGTPFAADAELGCADLKPDVGITGTPVIDQDSKTAYLAAKTKTGSTVAYDLHALDLHTGAERPNFPVRIGGTADNLPSIRFDATRELQRPALLLMDGVVYLAFGGHCDFQPYQGWVAGVSTGGQRTSLWTSALSVGGAGIWHAGGGLMSDGPGRIFLATGNGSAAPTGPGDQPPDDLGESVVRLAVGSGAAPAAQDFFSPYDGPELDAWDADFASGGPVALPSASELAGSPFGTPARPRVLVAVGKAGYVYLLDRDHLGGRGQGPGGGDDDTVVRLGPFGGVWSSPAVWPGDGGWVYIPTASAGDSGAGTSGSLDFYRAATDGRGLPTLDRVASTSDAFGFGSSAPVVTSSGMTSGSALVWIVWSPYPGGEGQLRAYRPTASAGGEPQLVFRAPVGLATKFNPPGVGEGRVYVGSADGHVLGFGAPVQPGLDGSDVAFAATTVGDSRTATATLTAHAALSVTGLSANGPFAIGSPSRALPATLRDGDTLSVPLTFSPDRAGPAGGTLTADTTAGTFSIALSGTGRLAGAHLAASPTVLSFGGTRTDQPVTRTVTFTNDGTDALTLGALDAPAAPFSVPAPPEPGLVLQPQAAVTLAVRFAPTAPGGQSSRLTWHSSGGDASVGLTGTASLPPRLAITEPGDFGGVLVGSLADRRLTVANNGGSRLTIMKSKPPAGGSFTALDPLPEGSVLQPGESRQLTIRFTPAAAGAASDAWVLTGDDGSGPAAVSLTGTGLSPLATTTPPPWPIGGSPPTQPQVAPRRGVARPRVTRVRRTAQRRRVVIRFTLSRAARVTLSLRHGRHTLRRAKVRGHRGRNRVVLRWRRRAGHYSLRLKPAGGRLVTVRLRIARAHRVTS
jgi:outer membrane protein assembly factor BamB